MPDATRGGFAFASMHLLSKNTSLSLSSFALLSIITSSLVLPGNAYAATCSLSFSMKPSVTSVESSRTFNYSLLIKNTGSGTCRDVSYSMFYASNELFVSSTPSPSASNYYWYFGNLGAKKQTTATVTVKHNSSVTGALIASEGCASARNGIDACAASQVSVVQKQVTVLPVTSPIISTSTVPIATTTTPVPAVPVSKKEKGMWVWNFPSQMNTTTGDTQMKTLASYGFNAVYITIDDYLEIAALPEGVTKNTKKAAYFAQLASFIQKANALGIVVDAEGGANNWSMSENRWKGFALIDAMKEYNNLYPNAKVRGFQYDVEPHTLSDYETNKAIRLKEYVEFVDQSMSRALGSNVALSIVIPHFFDDAQAWTPAITYNGTTAHTFNHLLSIMDKKQGSTILLMSYRNFFNGANGTKEISKVEIEKAAGHSTKVIVGQETGNVDPAFITFYSYTKTALFDALALSDSTFGASSGYGGTASHYLDSFLAMRNQ